MPQLTASLVSRVMGGRPCIWGIRVAMETVVGLVAACEDRHCPRVAATGERVPGETYAADRLPDMPLQSRGGL